MKFIRTRGTTELEHALSSALNTALAKNEPVLWLVPGGSNISIAVKVMASLDSANLAHLTIALTDERYGSPGHADSNYFQLRQNGFNPGGAQFADLLEGASFEETVDASSKTMEEMFAGAKTVIGFFGMGPDGHIAGILPHSPAAVSDETWMIGYDGGQFKRFTLAPFALSHIHQAFVGAFGESKLEALNNLHDKMLPITEQPAQILRHIESVTIYNDQIEGDSPAKLAGHRL